MEMVRSRIVDIYETVQVRAVVVVVVDFARDSGKWKWK